MIVTAIACALLEVGGAFALLSDLHMLQQNSYFASRYFTWLGGNLTKYIGRVLFLAILIVCSFWEIPFLVACTLYAVIEIPRWFSLRKKAITPLVFTARVKRQIVTASLILACVGVGTVLWCSAFAYALIALTTLTPFTAVLALWINAPIEAAVRRWYYCDAKRILRNHKPMTVIGITGSYGKTSTKYALARLLDEKYNVCYTPGNFNTTLGVVRTIREHLKPTDDIFIVEMGAKKVGDIREICDLVEPDLGIITSVGEQHLDTFKSLENIVRTKFELADAVNRKHGKIYLNMDCAPEAERAPQYDFVGYGHGDCDVRITDGGSDRLGSSFALTREGRILSLQTKLLGAHAIVNVAGAAAVAMDLGVSDRDLRFAVRQLAPVSHRLELKPYLKGSLLIDDAYNANPAGCLEAVRVLSAFEGYRKIIITPGLVELGEREYACNAALGRAAMDACDLIVFVGQKRSEPLVAGAKESPKYYESRVHVVSAFREAVDLIAGSLDASTVVLLENDLPDNYSK
ncbi:MAG: UDP-N-acetylmuramoyl-tripeptide--D-alanyl-D-alanine ligase [Clostridia bacterium]|nr:UDP-N-acetylmuramoyl-tripeptide--D-alanyl-D-alanine ligase [Clostridia bacterium]